VRVGEGCPGNLPLIPEDGYILETPVSIELVHPCPITEEYFFKMLL
jgi:hypothetical protein